VEVDLLDGGYKEDCVFESKGKWVGGHFGLVLVPVDIKCECSSL
jgi:hypothetical protein